ncbi:hypothetical protein MJN76_31270, partial [Salmonella enterica subsp. enterica serovar Anatum]|nr:hypothetical protein [Salmonella enterica subsp. enterica serovar Anatum]
KIPGLLKSQGLDDYICKRFSLNCPEANLSEWEQVIYEEANPAWKKYGIDNHFQYHLINYNEPTAYAALTLCRSTIMEMIMSYTL